MGRMAGRPLALSEAAGETLLQLLAYAARVDGPVTLREVAALDGAARGLGLRDRAKLLGRLPLDGGRLRPPSLDGLSALERRIAFGAAAWMARVEGGESYVARAFLDDTAEGAGLGEGEAGTLRAEATRTRRKCGGVVPWSVEFERFVLEIVSLYALDALGPAAPSASAARRDAPRVAAGDEPPRAVGSPPSS